MIEALIPSVQRTIWGGKKLEKMKSLKTAQGELPIGETWEISVHPQGRTLDLRPQEEMPYLVKFIDTQLELSVQVHPGDEYATLHEKDSGKSECWLILEASEGAGIYLGIKPGVTKELFESAIKNKEKMNEYLNYFPVKRGDFFYVEAGTAHSIGGGITLAEIQQNSGITYRVWDWDRLDEKGQGRELHIKKSLDVLDFLPEHNSKSYFRMAHDLFSKKGFSELVNHPFFRVVLFNLSRGEKMAYKIERKNNRVTSLLSFQGEFNLNSQLISSYQAVIIRDEDQVEIEALDSTSFIIIE